ncbi:MAG: PTS sugar transporter subunit IIA [Verrucomicrobiota bacterium]|nr:PTS sugar transporter subunit IIA [Verrucomicrobiota bacterium]
MNISNFIKPELIVCDLEGENRRVIYMRMLNIMADVENLENPEEICNQIIENEDLKEIPYEMGLAIPHSRTADVDDLHIMIGIHKKGVLLKENDMEPSRVIVMCLIAKATSNVYLLTLQAFSRHFLKKGTVDDLAACSNPNEVIEYFKNESVEIGSSLVAENIMLDNYMIVKENSTVKNAIDLLVRSGRLELPVVDEENSFKGVFAAEKVLRGGIPDYVMMMDNLNFLKKFEPFEKLLRNEDSMNVADVIHTEHVCVSPDTPVIQIIVRLLKSETDCFYVTDADGKLLGLISINEIVSNLLRG